MTRCGVCGGRRVAVVGALAMLVVACGGTRAVTTRATPTSTSTALASPESPTATSSVAASSLVLGTDQLPSGSGEVWTLAGSSDLAGDSSSVQVSWTSLPDADGLEVDAVVDASAHAATDDWAAWEKGVVALVSQPLSGSCPAGLPTDCAAFSGTSAESEAPAAVVIWQQQQALVAVVLVSGQGAVDTAYCRSVAEAQMQMITRVLG